MKGLEGIKIRPLDLRYFIVYHLNISVQKSINLKNKLIFDNDRRLTEIC